MVGRCRSEPPGVAVAAARQLALSAPAALTLECLSVPARRDLAAVSHIDFVHWIARRASQSGAWALIAADGAVVLVPQGQRMRAREEVAERIRRERRAGLSLRQIAAWPRSDRIPAPRGRAPWGHGQVRWHLARG